MVSQHAFQVSEEMILISRTRRRACPLGPTKEVTAPQPCPGEFPDESGLLVTAMGLAYR